MDPSTGTWLSVDPILGTPERPSTLNPWLYSEANPLRLRDPTGEAGEVLSDAEPLVGQVYRQEVDQLTTEQASELLSRVSVHYSLESSRGNLAELAKDREALLDRLCSYLECKTSSVGYYGAEALRIGSAKGKAALDYLNSRPDVKKLKETAKNVGDAYDENKESLITLLSDMAADACASPNAGVTGTRFCNEGIRSAAAIELRLAASGLEQVGTAKAFNLGEGLLAESSALLRKAETEEEVAAAITKAYSKVRPKSPSGAIQKMVNQGRVGPFADPALPGFVADVLEADHIVALKEVVRKPGFTQLTEENMLKVVNFRRNFIGLTKSANASKGAKDWFEWTMHKRTGTMVRPEFAAKMQRKQLKLEYQLQELINDLLRGQK